MSFSRRGWKRDLFAKAVKSKASMATEEPFSWALAGLFTPRPTDAASKESGWRWDALLHPNSKPRAPPSSADAGCQRARIFLTVVILPGKESFHHFKDVNAFAQCFILAYALSPLL